MDLIVDSNQNKLSRVRSILKKLIDELPIISIVFLFGVMNLLWISIFRADSILDIDEAGYFSISFVDYYALINHGWIDWLQTVESPSIQSPITTMITSFFFLIFGPKLITGFIVLLFFAIVTLIAVYSLSRYLGGKYLGLMTCLLLATCPTFINFARTYHFALPASAITTLALLALLRSERFENLKWSIIFGVCLGLMPLTRTMTIGFIPGLVISAIFYSFGSPYNRWRRFSFLFLSFFIGICIAAIWLIPNGKLVFDYLLSFGYGNRVAEYANAETRGLFSNLCSLLDTIRYFLWYIYLPDFIFIFVGFVLLTFCFFKLMFTNGWRKSMSSIFKSKIFPIVLFVLEGFIAISSSQNKGSGFILPLLPAIFFLSAWVVIKLWDRSKKIFWGTSIIILISTLSCIPLIYLKIPFSFPRSVHLPILGSSKVMDGLCQIHRYLGREHHFKQRGFFVMDSHTAKLWVDANILTVDKISSLKEKSSLIAFGFRNVLCNVNTVNLQHLILKKCPLFLTQVEPAITDDTADGYYRWLTKGSAASASILITASGTQGDFLPTINENCLKEAAQKVGFFPIEHLSLPNDRIVTFWKRSIKET